MNGEEMENVAQISLICRYIWEEEYFLFFSSYFV